MSSVTTDLVVPPANLSDKSLWPEPLDTPGLVPRHLKRSATASYPLLEVLQRLLYRLRPVGASGVGLGDVEKVLALIGLYQAARPVFKHLKDFCLWAFTVQITVPENDAVAREILTWMGSEVISKSRTRSAMLVSSGVEQFNPGFPHPPPLPGGRQSSQDVVCMPPVGTRIFWVGFRPFLFSRAGGRSHHRHMVMPNNMVDEHGQAQNALTISTLGWSLDPLRDFTDLCHEFKLNNMTGTTTVYYAGNNGDPYSGWQSVSKAMRRLDTIDMDEEVKADLIRDAEYYYSDQSRNFFADCGIPYRRGYLFHGPPGTGKSSFSAALAGHLQCDIYHINLASGNISDGSLHQLFLGLPRKCVVVIEDIDSAGIGREMGPESVPPPPPSPPELDSEVLMPHGPHASLRRAYRYASVPPPPPRNNITLSGLLNAIDGNASQEGRLLIMTSNNPDVLDAALTRPGRIDKKVYFGNMTKTAGKSIFMRLIGRAALAHDAAYTMAEIEQYAAKFAERVPANVFTPAQVQNFLQACRADPIKALRDIDAWVEENRGATDSTDSETPASVISHPSTLDESFMGIPDTSKESAESSKG